MKSCLPLFNIANLINYLDYKGVENKEVIDYSISLVNEFEGSGDDLLEVAISLSEY